MRILLLIEREPGGDVTWIADAVDEDTLADVGMPEAMSTALAERPADVRQLWVEIPDGSFTALWDAPTVTGTTTPS